MWHIYNEGKKKVQDLLIDTLLTFLLLWHATLFLWCKMPYSSSRQKRAHHMKYFTMHSFVHLCEEYWSVIVVVMSLTFFIAVLWYSGLDFWLKKWWECTIFQITDFFTLQIFQKQYFSNSVEECLHSTSALSLHH